MYIDVDYDSMMSSFTGGLEQNCGMVCLMLMEKLYAAVTHLKTITPDTD